MYSYVCIMQNLGKSLLNFSEFTWNLIRVLASVCHVKSFIVVFKVLRVYRLIFKFEIFHHVLKMTFCLLTNCKLCRNMCQCTTSVVLTCPGMEYLVGTFLLVLSTYISITSLPLSGAFSLWGPNSTAQWRSSSKLAITKTHYMMGKYILDKNCMNDTT